ncbi:universal stress protein [Cellulosimicrobium arenosum]|uniref:Universal stress protein n=1 Tax=Cellulosimicrobium arenosum TaxID=2708133 RepID=A0A927G6A0_9MICO|nr:universal stress protein [Cellulosimicrobium arenosum]MBD8077583.1 universal stress protein [Cellulosimicrobium arenosum]
MTVVVAQLSTPEGREALSTAAAEAVRRHVDLAVVVADTQDPSDADADGLDEVTARVADGGTTLVRHPATGDLAEDLVAVAESTGAELIVIGLRRRSPVGKLILGTNAQRILLDAPCPVLAVKPERP